MEHEKITTIYLDMDGVTFNWLEATAKLLNIDLFADENSYRPIGERASKREIWKTIGKMGESFWSTIPVMQYGKDLYWLCKSYVEDVIFLTAPSEDPASLSGKSKALREVFNCRAKDVIFANDKWRLAKPNTLLIDDNEGKINDFEKHGGQIFLWPTPLGSYDTYKQDIEIAFDILSARLYAN